MVVGEKRRFWIPQELAYKGRDGAPAGMLVFDVELFSITPGVAPPSVPEDVAGPPAGTKSTASGLAYRTLKAGTGSVHPTKESMVSVHYSGWTTDGKLFDSSVMRNKPAEFSLSGVIPGWTEGVQLMVEGEKTRFWIPKALAYGDGGGGAPGGTLVFDVELLKILR
jgi:peptidylprolyl isomerase